VTDYPGFIPNSAGRTGKLRQRINVPDLDPGKTQMTDTSQGHNSVRCNRGTAFISHSFALEARWVCLISQKLLQGTTLSEAATPYDSF
jgi:hypothetical protein